MDGTVSEFIIPRKKRGKPIRNEFHFGTKCHFRHCEKYAYSEKDDEEIPYYLWLRVCECGTHKDQSENENLVEWNDLPRNGMKPHTDKCRIPYTKAYSRKGYQGRTFTEECYCQTRSKTGLKIDHN